jgi:predicted TIM-barrel fold metal-dependent hydrolase
MRSDMPGTTRCDTHAHVFKRGLPLAPGRRHAPDYDALPETYLDLLDAQGLRYGLLTAPSFLGTDNAYLLGVLEQNRERLRGTVIVDPTIDRAALEDMGRSGAVGIRLNLFGMSALPDLSSAAYRRLFGYVAELDWHVEIYLEGPKLAKLLPLITSSGAKVVVDHFGSPDPGSGVECAGFRAVLHAIEGGRTWVKLSAPYRLGGGDAKAYAAALLRAAGPARLLWGSDWPWTQHSDGVTYPLTLDWLAAWVPDAAARETILGETPHRLFHFDRVPK